MTNPTHHSCCTCGFVWLHGEDGSHFCAERLISRIQTLERELAPPRDRLAELVALDGMVQALTLIVKYYADPNTSHVDYRVRACRLAAQALAELNLAPTKAEPVVNQQLTTERAPAIGCERCGECRRGNFRSCENRRAEPAPLCDCRQGRDPCTCEKAKAELVEQCAWPSGEFDNCRHLVLPGKKYCKHHQQWEGQGND